MSVIPGITNDNSAHFELSTIGSDSKNITTVKVPRYLEWRVEIPFLVILKIVVSKGIAEIYGTELPVSVDMQFSGCNICLYAPEADGFVVEYSTATKSSSSVTENHEISEYISEESIMNQVTNLHFLLELFRQRAEENNEIHPERPQIGPKVLVIGGADTGKTTLVRTLAAYANKMERCPVMVNLDPKEGVFALPGSLSATPISDAFDVEGTNGWGGTPTSGITYHNPKQPIVKNFGFEKINDNLDLFKYQSTQLALSTMSRTEQDSSIKSSGILIDTPTFSIKDSTLIENIVSDFEVNIMVVIGNERLLNDLKKKFKRKLDSKQLHVLKMPKSGGVVEVDDTFVRNIQQQTIKEYFYGNWRCTLSPYNTVVDMKDVIIYKCVEAGEANSNLAFLPSGSYAPEDLDPSDSTTSNDLVLEKYYTKITEPNASILNNSILAITQVSQNDKQEKKLLNTSVRGYAYVSDVDDTKGKMRILLPVPGTLPRNILILTGIRYIE